MWIVDWKWIVGVVSQLFLQLTSLLKIMYFDGRDHVQVNCCLSEGRKNLDWHGQQFPYNSLLSTIHLYMILPENYCSWQKSIVAMVDYYNWSGPKCTLKSMDSKDLWIEFFFILFIFCVCYKVPNISWNVKKDLT